MKKLFTGIAIFAALFASAQTKQQRTVADFTSITGSTGLQIELTQGNENAVWVSASDDAYLDNIKTVVEKGMLKLSIDNHGQILPKKSKLKVFVTYKAINTLRGNSGAIISTTNAIAVPQFTFAFNSGATFDGELKTDDLTIEQSSGALVKVKGTATNVKADISSGGIFTGNNLSSETCRANATTGGIIKIGVSKKLTATVSTGGVVNYKGTPEVEKSASLGGIVSKI